MAGSRQARWADLLDAITATRERSRQSIDKLAACDPRTLTFTHGRLGDLDLAQWWLLQAEHDRDHLAQIRSIKTAPGFPAIVKVVLRNPRREVEVAGNRRVKDVLRELDIIPETVLVIRGDDLITTDQMVRDDDVIELRPVMSGGAR